MKPRDANRRRPRVNLARRPAQADGSGVTGAGDATASVHNERARRGGATPPAPLRVPAADGRGDPAPATRSAEADGAAVTGTGDAAAGPHNWRARRGGAAPAAPLSQPGTDGRGDPAPDPPASGDHAPAGVGAAALPSLANSAALTRSTRALSLKTYALGTAIAALWGASFVLTKASLGVLGPMGIAFMRWAISAVVLAGWVAARGKLPAAARMARSDGLRVIWLALTGITLFYGLQNVALGYTTATNAGILANLTTVFMVLMAVLGYGERLSLLEWLMLALAFAGAALVSQGSGHFTISGPGLRGDLLMVVATLFAAIYSVQSKRVTARYPADVVTAGVATAGALLLLPLALYEGLRLDLPPAAWSSLLLLGLGSGALANLWWLGLLAYTDASRAGVILFIVPVFSTALAVILLHEPLTPIAAVGAALVLIGMAVMQRRET